MASEYGWAKADILGNVYLDEVLLLQKHIKRRTFENYKMQLAIVQNPHAKSPKDLWDMLNAETIEVVPDEPLDKAAFENFKRVVSSGQAVQVK